MIRTITIDGFLGTAPEVKTTSNGREFTTFRVANRAYGDAENVTYWFSVTVWEAGLQKFCQSLKKGSAVIITGDYNDRTYKSNVTGTDEIGRDIRATAIHFPTVGRREDDAQAGQNAPAQEAPAAINQTSAAPAKETKAKASAAPAPETNSDDDLPF